jgi:hypothetical protein
VKSGQKGTQLHTDRRLKRKAHANLSLKTFFHLDPSLILFPPVIPGYQALRTGVRTIPHKPPQLQALDHNLTILHHFIKDSMTTEQKMRTIEDLENAPSPRNQTMVMDNLTQCRAGEDFAAHYTHLTQKGIVRTRGRERNMKFVMVPDGSICIT